MSTYSGHTGRIEVDISGLTLSRDTTAGRMLFGKVPPRRFPWSSLSDVEVEHPSRLTNGHLRLLLRSSHGSAGKDFDPDEIAFTYGQRTVMDDLILTIRNGIAAHAGVVTSVADSAAESRVDRQKRTAAERSERFKVKNDTRRAEAAAKKVERAAVTKAERETAEARQASGYGSEDMTARHRTIAGRRQLDSTAYGRACPHCGSTSFKLKRSKGVKATGLAVGVLSLGVGALGVLAAPKHEVKCQACGRTYRRG